MLVLTRKPGERIVIGEEIVVTLVSIRRDDQYGDRIRIGLEAPSHVPIRRQEVDDPRAVAEARLDAVEGESRQVRQKLDALGCQIGRAQQLALDARRAEHLSEALQSLRRRCDELLDELGRVAPIVAAPLPGSVEKETHDC